MSVILSRRLSGHKSSLLCCHSPLSDPNLLSTSAQDGRVCLFDIRNKDNVMTFECFEQDDVSSICFTPGNAHTLYTAAGMSIYCIDTRRGSLTEPLQKYTFNTDEINQLTLNKKGSLLAAGDDRGEIKVIDLNGHKLFKTLRNVHTNICSTVQFHPQRPWELISGGLDAKLVKWDIVKGKPLKIVDQGAGSSQGSSEQLCNPPFVHALAVPEGKVTGEAGKVMAVARGDGAVEYCDMMLERWKPGVKQCKTLHEDTKDVNSNLDQSKEFNHDLSGHKSAVSCVTFARFVQSKTLVISGSNDRSVKLWDLQCKNDESSSLNANGTFLLLTKDHRRKVNWICTSSRDSENLFVADTSNKLTIYTVS